MARYVPERFRRFCVGERPASRTASTARRSSRPRARQQRRGLWIKRDRGLIVDTMYATKHYHEDITARSWTIIASAKAAGDGGLGIWDGKKLFVSSKLEELEAHHHRPDPFGI